MSMERSCCESCLNYQYDEEYDEYFCGVDMDEDDAEALYMFQTLGCPYYDPGDEYKIVNKQI